MLVWQRFVQGWEEGRLPLSLSNWSVMVLGPVPGQQIMLLGPGWAGRRARRNTQPRLRDAVREEARVEPGVWPVTVQIRFGGSLSLGLWQSGKVCDIGEK